MADPAVACGEERWLPAARNPAYAVSSHGRVRREARGPATRPGRFLTPWPSDRGYLYVDLGRGCRGVAVHVLVLETFGPPRPAGFTVDHVDWNRSHNCVRNLRWLAHDLNSVRWWSARTADGRNVWATKDDPPPCDHEPLTPEQERVLLSDLSAAGWSA